MPRQQMICFVTPGAPAAAGPRAQRALAAFAERIGRIHFATLALLPPAPDAPEGQAPELLLEVVVDEDLALADLLDLALARAFGALWRLYRPNWRGLPDADRATRRAWLRAFLLEHASLPECGFVGARDRGVAQVRQEHRLFQAARAAVQGLPAGQRPADAAALADGLRRWAAAAGFGWVAASPAPRSRWRKGPGFGLAGWAAVAARLVLPVPALLGLLMGFGWLVHAAGLWLHARGLAVPDDPTSAVLLAALPLLLALAVSAALAATTRLGILGLVAVVFLAMLLPLYDAGAALYARDWAPLRSWGGYALAGALSLLAFAAAAMLAMQARVLLAVRVPPFFPLAAILGTALATLAVAWWCARRALALLASPDWMPAPLPLAAQPALQTRLAWGLAAVALMFAIVLALRFVAALMARLARLPMPLNRPAPLPAAPLHQVHPSVAACEADLAARNAVGHMISLTDIRRPYAWHRFWLRRWLRFVHLLGDIVFTEGILGSASGIKFGHWRIVGNGRRLLFCSNFDGAFGGYLDEFIQGASEGVNLIWRRTELRPRRAARPGDPAVTAPRRYPPTRLGIYGGCKAEQAFKAYARASMVPHLARYEAYSLSNEDIERGTRLREALRGTPSAVKDDRIARALES